MFDENFSFTSTTRSTSHTDSIKAWTAAEISPYTSRCSSPHESQSATPCRDVRFDAYRLSGNPGRPSITALTAQLQSHALNDSEMLSPSPPPSDVASPTACTPDTDLDEGFYDSPETPATPISDLYESGDLDPALWDLSMSDGMVPTSSPRPSLSLEAQALSSYTMRRRQRQALIRLQCLVSRAPDLAMLLEECHPSSLPFEDEIKRASIWAGQRDSSCCGSGSGYLEGANNGRIEKSRSGSSATVRKAARMRKTTR